MEHEAAQLPESSDQSATEKVLNSTPDLQAGADSSFETENSLIVRDGESETDGEHRLPFPVVGIGGSAGSLEPFIQVFQRLPPNTGMAFVVVLHLLPNQESRLPEILQRHTTMPVVSIEEGTEIQANNVYVIPPNALVFLNGTSFHLEPRQASGPFLPVNELFQSIAKAQKNFSLGVVLSGMDGDGAVGLRAIKGEGGFAIVQAPESARHAAMPTSSIENDHVDLVLQPSDIAVQLASLGQRFGDPNWLRVEEGDASLDDSREFARILKLLKQVSGVDFRLYKPSTIRRRVARRMVMHKVESLPEYALLLQSNHLELRALQEDILINVTRFFRDPDVFEMLKINVIPHLLSDREADQPVRVWVAGCSSGEEVYSIAICLLEQLSGYHTEPGIQIFGTDASEENIHKARLGYYSESIVNEVSAERLRRFFTKSEKGYQINKRVRDLCVFARQNLCTDPPFSRIDLVSCRNVLIYFGPELQRRVISTFHYALRRDGFLLLGSSESIREYTDLFASTDRIHKLFTRIESPGHRANIPSFAPLHYADHPLNSVGFLPVELRRDTDLNRLTDRTMLARYSPPGVVINGQMDILQTRGRTSPFLEMAPGIASLKLGRMLRDSIVPEVIAAVTRSIEAGLPVQVDPLRMTEGQETIEAKLEVLPMPSGDPEVGVKYYLVTFQPPAQYASLAPATPGLPSGAETVSADGSATQLRQDLAATKLYLNALLDERDATNQELISANEEIQSSNEELQSTNEELETTKEELQSSNEELQTVNDELEDRNFVLTQASNDLTNLLNSVNMPVLMLSNELYIRHFTPQTQRLMNLRPQDVGRPFGEIRLNLAVDDLEERLLGVLETLTPQEIEVQDRDGRWYFLRVRPYRTTDNKIDGLVLVLVDIDQSRRNQQELRDARDFAASIIANTPLPLVVANKDYRAVYLNDAFCELSHLSRQSIDGRDITEIVGHLWHMGPPLRALLQDVIQNRSTDGGFECEYKHVDDGSGTLLVQAKPLQPDGERFSLVTFEDISAHKRIEHLLKGEGKRLTAQVADTTRELDRSRAELRALTDSLMTSQEDERRRLARELHDDVSQRMALLDMECEAALRTLESDPVQARKKLEQLRTRVAEISADTRKLSHRLHPSILEHLGLAAALESLLDEFKEREGMITSFYSDHLPEDLAPDLATGLYRITQEALRNVVKHAGDAHVKVSLDGCGERLLLEVTDSGKGFDVERHGYGLGLVSMKERARLLGATLNVQSAPRRGTTITVEVPSAALEG